MATSGTGAIPVVQEINQLITGVSISGLAINRCPTKEIIQNSLQTGYSSKIPTSYANNQLVPYSDIIIVKTSGGVSYTTDDNTSSNLDGTVLYSSTKLNIPNFSSWQSYITTNSINCKITSSSGNSLFYRENVWWDVGYYYFIVYASTYGHHLYEFYISSANAETLKSHSITMHGNRIGTIALA